MTASEESTDGVGPALQRSDEEQALPEVVTNISYVRVNDGVRCYDEDDTLEEEVVDAVSSQHLALRMAVNTKTVILMMSQ